MKRRRIGTGDLSFKLGTGSIALIIVLVTAFFLPGGRPADPTVSLRPRVLLRDFAAIIREPQFHTYVLAGAFSFAGLFVYVAGSPILFMDVFHVSPQTYGLIFVTVSKPSGVSVICTMCSGPSWIT